MPFSSDKTAAIAAPTLISLAEATLYNYLVASILGILSSLEQSLLALIYP